MQWLSLSSIKLKIKVKFFYAELLLTMSSRQNLPGCPGLLWARFQCATVTNIQQATVCVWVCEWALWAVSLSLPSPSQFSLFPLETKVKTTPSSMHSLIHTLIQWSTYSTPLQKWANPLGSHYSQPFPNAHQSPGSNQTSERRWGTLAQFKVGTPG